MAVAHGEGTALPCAQPCPQLHSSTLSLPPLPQDDFVELFAHHPWGLGIPYLASTSGCWIGQRQVKAELEAPLLYIDTIQVILTGRNSWARLLHLAELPPPPPWTAKISQNERRMAVSPWPLEGFCPLNGSGGNLVSG